NKQASKLTDAVVRREQTKKPPTSCYKQPTDPKQERGEAGERRKETEHLLWEAKKLVNTPIRKSETSMWASLQVLHMTGVTLHYTSHHIIPSHSCLQPSKGRKASLRPFHPASTQMSLADVPAVK
ncbi:hypothetical protein JOQ06_015735, partial [Pogonophryne albipinna]